VFECLERSTNAYINFVFMLLVIISRHATVSHECGIAVTTTCGTRDGRWIRYVTAPLTGGEGRKKLQISSMLRNYSFLWN